MLRRVFLGCLLLAVGCGAPQSQEPASAPTPTPAPAPAEVAVAPPASSEPTPEATSPERAAPPAAVTTSIKCPVPQSPRDDRPSGMCSLCPTNSDELLVALQPADAISIPSDAAVVSQSAKAKSPRELEYMIAVTADALVAQVFTCPGCRRRMGWGLSVPFEKLRKLDQENRSALQTQLGFASTPLLGTHDEWKSAKPSGVPSSVPNLPGCRK